jgi:hypothetical protein
LSEKLAAPVKKPELTAWGKRCADHETPSIRKELALTSQTSGGRSVGIVRLRTKGHGVCFILEHNYSLYEAKTSVEHYLYPLTSKKLEKCR